MFRLALRSTIFKKSLKMAQLDRFYISKILFNTTFEVRFRKVPPNFDFLGPLECVWGVKCKRSHLIYCAPLFASRKKINEKDSFVPEKYTYTMSQDSILWIIEALAGPDRAYLKRLVLLLYCIKQLFNNHCKRS